jgi:Mg2+ and Co2+ transporter CorA
LPWLLLVGPNVVVTIHRDQLAFLDDIAALEDPDSRIGKLGADSFAAGLLDRMLTSYFDAVDAFEDRLDHLEVEILKPRVRNEHLPELRRLRADVSRLRRLLSSHRDLFDAMARPRLPARPAGKSGKAVPRRQRPLRTRDGRRRKRARPGRRQLRTPVDAASPSARTKACAC